MVRDPILLHFCASAPKGQISMPPSKCINCIHYGTGKHGSSAQRTRFNTLLNEEWKKRRRRTPRVALTPAFDVAVYEFGSTHILWLQCGQPNHPDQALDWIAGTVCLKLAQLTTTRQEEVRETPRASEQNYEYSNKVSAKRFPVCANGRWSTQNTFDVNESFRWDRNLELLKVLIMTKIN